MNREQLLGAWELVSFAAVDSRTGERFYPLGPDATGFILYTTDGFMSAQIMASGRPDYDAADFAGGTPSQLAAAARGYMAYSGPYEFDERAGVVRHHLDVSLMPNWLNSVQVRNESIDGDRLTLSAEDERTDMTITATVEWKRASRPSE